MARSCHDRCVSNLRPLLFLAVTACVGAGGSGPGAAIDADDASALCRDVCAHDDDCGNGSFDCQSQCELHASVDRADVARPALTCIAALPCDQDPETCWQSATDAVTPTDAYQQLLAACQSYDARCGTSSQCDDPGAIALSDGIAEALADCFTRACGDFDACRDQVLPY